MVNNFKFNLTLEFRLFNAGNSRFNLKFFNSSLIHLTQFLLGKEKLYWFWVGFFNLRLKNTFNVISNKF